MLTRTYGSDCPSSSQIWNLIWKTINAPGDHQMGVQKGSYDFKQFVLGGFWGHNRNMPLYSRFDEIAKEFFRARQIPILDVEPLYYRQDRRE